MNPTTRCGSRIRDVDERFLLDRIESEMGDADPDIQWTMNIALAETGVQFPKHRKRALKIGETLGDLPGLPHIEGLHLTLRADLDQRDGEAAGLIGSRRSLAVAGDRPNLSSCLQDLLDDLQAVGPLRVGDRLGLALQLTDPDAYDGLSVHRPVFSSRSFLNYRPAYSTAAHELCRPLLLFQECGGHDRQEWRSLWCQ